MFRTSWIFPHLSNSSKCLVRESKPLCRTRRLASDLVYDDQIFIKSQVRPALSHPGGEAKRKAQRLGNSRIFWDRGASKKN